MFEKTSLSLRLIGVAGMLLLVSSCAVTTRSTEGSSETFQNTSEASTQFTSSTSPRDEDKDAETQNVRLFAKINLERLKEDMARGGGEHLTAFSHLLGIREAHQTDFFAFTKRNYPVLFGSEPTTADDLLARLDSGLSANSMWRQ